MNMKKITLFLLVLFLAIASQAQERGNRRMHRIKGHSDMMIQKLNITDDQKAKFKSMNEDFRKQREELKKNEDITVREWKSRMKALREDHQAKLKGLLTSD